MHHKMWTSSFRLSYKGLYQELKYRGTITDIRWIGLSSKSRNSNDEDQTITKKSSLSYISKEDEEEQFRVLELVKKKFEKKQKKVMNDLYFKQPREKRLRTDHDWGNVWPTARSFHPATVPLPVRMGAPPHRGKASPDKWANAELMKIPNFLHLSPPVIERQCEAIKKFCTKWPENLETEEQQNFHFPVTVKRSTYLHSSPTIRDPRSRIATLKVSPESLNLDEHGLDKMLRLVNERFDPKSNMITLTADRCPLSSQNIDYCFFLLTVLYNESVKTESWEQEKQIQDAQYYSWNGSPSDLSLQRLALSANREFSEEAVQHYSSAVTNIHNKGETEESLQDYKKAVLTLLNL